MVLKTSHTPMCENVFHTLNRREALNGFKFEILNLCQKLNKLQNMRQHLVQIKINLY